MAVLGANDFLEHVLSIGVCVCACQLGCLSECSDWQRTFRAGRFDVVTKLL